MAAICVVAGCAVPPSPPAPSKAPLRVALVQGNLAQAAKEPSTGEYRGASIDVARELARRWSRPLEITEMSPAGILEAIGKGTIDLGFVAPNPDRAGAALFSKPYMFVQQSALVSDRSSIKSVRELDQAGRRVGANSGDSVAGFLKRTLREASVVESADMSMGEALAWLDSGSVIAFAGNRQRLAATIRGKPGFHLLPDNLYAVPQAVAVAANRPELLAEVNGLLEQLRQSGFTEQAVRASGVDGLTAAP